MTPTYQLAIDETLRDAWQRVFGCKKTFIAAFLILFLFTLFFVILKAIFKQYTTLVGVIDLIDQLVMYLLQAGLVYMGITRAKDLPIKHDLVFRAFQWDITWRVFVLYLLQTLIMLPPMLLAIGGALYVIPRSEVNIDGTTITTTTITPGMFLHPVPIICFIIALIAILYLAIKMSLSMGLIVDKIENPLHAIGLSFKGTRGNFWRILAISIVMFICIFVSILLIGIPLIWTIPFAFITYGVIYRKLQVNIPFIDATAPAR